MEPTTTERPTGYESIRDLGDQADRGLIPKGTECVLGIVSAVLNTEGGKGKERIDMKFEVLAPEAYEDWGTFTRSYYLGNVPKPGNRADQTSWHISRREWGQIIAAIYQVPYEKDFVADEVRNFFSGVEADPSTDLIAFFEETAATLNSLANQNFPTIIGVEIDKKGEYPPKQRVGKPLYPTAKEFEAQQARGGNGQA